MVTGVAIKPGGEWKLLELDPAAVVGVLAALLLLLAMLIITELSCCCGII